MNELQSEIIPVSSYNPAQWDGIILVLIIGAIALVFVGYLVYDWIRGQQALRRIEELRHKSRRQAELMQGG